MVAGQDSDQRRRAVSEGTATSATYEVTSRRAKCRKASAVKIAE